MQMLPTELDFARAVARAGGSPLSPRAFRAPTLGETWYIGEATPYIGEGTHHTNAFHDCTWVAPKGTSAWYVRETAPVFGAAPPGPDQLDHAEADSVTALGEQIMTLSERI